MANLPATSNPFGRDLATGPNEDGVIDLYPEMAEVTERDVLAQSLVRRQLTPKGSDLSSPNDGIDLFAWVKKGMTTTELAMLPGTVTQELLRDERVFRQGTSVTATMSPTGTLKLVEFINSSTGPFKLTLTIDKVSVEVLVASQ